MYQLINLDPRTWAYEAVMDDGDSVRFFVLAGSETCLVIDSGFLPVDIHGMAEDLLRDNGQLYKTNGEKKPVVLANTHGDMDHTGGNNSFPFFYMDQADYDRMDLKNKYPNAKLCAVSDGDTLNLGDRVLRFISIPGHTYGNTAILDITNRILFPGDIIQTGNMFMFGSHRCTEKMAGSLQKLYRLKPEFDKIYTCHGKPILPGDAVDSVIEAWDKVIHGEIKPAERRHVFDTDVDLYRCGFVNFLYNKDEKTQNE